MEFEPFAGFAAGAGASFIATYGTEQLICPTRVDVTGCRTKANFIPAAIIGGLSLATSVIAKNPKVVSFATWSLIGTVAEWAGSLWYNRLTMATPAGGQYVSIFAPHPSAPAGQPQANLPKP